MSTPLHTRLKEDIIAAIRSGEYAAGSQIPSQRELGTFYNVSHMTVRRAIDELLHEGVISSIPGKGLFVAMPRQEAETNPLLSFSADMQRRGLQPSTTVLEARATVASTVVAQLLRLPSGAPVVYLRRLRCANGEPIALQTSYLSHARCSGLLEHDLAHESLFRVLRERYGLRLDSSESTVSCGLADAETAELLRITPPAALLITEQITFLEDGSPIEFVRSAYRGDRYEIRVTKDM